ncbi:hypothetical protein [Roseospira visakhapatnamensis]|uniref:MCE family protein n=1 Tax=Roseospira visakhapatnamensis TaxID=390880 RepID=A0A7W6RC66_9PROT|nr:hypothetical protein [Roseospira visakhapatnamensis]MBB4265213.1 hypothetical protein [Roseospira visakhapatnamensis]
MRDSQLVIQNRLVGGLTLVVGLLVAVASMLAWPVLVDDDGALLHTLATDVDGVQTGSIVVLNGHEIGQVTDVTVAAEDVGADEAETEAPVLDAARPMFRVGFSVNDGVVLPADTTRLRVARPNPVSLARLVVVQVDAAAPPPAGPASATAPIADVDDACATALGAVRAAPPPPACPPPAGATFTAGDCVPMADTGDLPPDGLDGLILQANALLCETRATRARIDETLATVDETLLVFRQAGVDLATIIASARPALDQALPAYAALPDRLDRSLDDLDAAIDAMEGAVAEDIPERLDRFRRDIVGRADRLLDPATVAAFTRAVRDLEVLVAESSRQSFQVMQNLAAASRNLNEIARELNRDPAGFLFRDRGGSDR